MNDSQSEIARSGELPEEIEPGPTPAKPESAFRRFLRRAVRWVLALAIAFALGALAVAWLFYRPKVEELGQARAGLQQAQGQITELQAEVERLSALDAERQTLQANLETMETRLAILSALEDIQAARLALATEDEASARASLSNTASALEGLANRVEPEQRDLLEAMQNRLKLALEEMGRDAFAAQSDLGVLAANLTQLENSYLETP